MRIDVSPIHYLHERQCFLCLEPFDLQRTNFYHCQLCPRSYHKQCDPACTSVKKNRVGPCCRNDQDCQLCPFVDEEYEKLEEDDEEQKMQEKRRKDLNMLACSICTRKVHVECFHSFIKMQPQVTENIGRSLSGTEHYVCKECLSRLGITKVIQVTTKHKMALFTFETDRAVLVQIRHECPLHYGWFREMDVEKVFRNQKANPSLLQVQGTGYMEKKINNPKYKLAPAKIEKILACHHYRQNIPHSSSVQFIDDLERANEIKHVSNENFKILVKWKSATYQASTWQDEIILKNYQLRSLYVQALAHKNFHSNQISFEKRYHYLKNVKRIILQEAGSEVVNKMCRYRHLYKAQIITPGEIKQPNSKDSIKTFCQFLTRVYLQEKQTKPTLILTDDVVKWENALPTTFLHYVCWRGSKESIRLIRQIQFSQRESHVDILVMSYKNYAKQKQFVKDKMGDLAILICDNVSDTAFIESLFQTSRSQLQVQKYIFTVRQSKDQTQMKPSKVSMAKFKKQTIDVDNDKQEKGVIQRIVKQLPLSYCLKHNQDWSEVTVLHSTLVRNIEFGEQQLSHQKRFAFLNYVLRFGLNIEDLGKIFNCIFRSSNNMQGPTSSEEQEEEQHRENTAEQEEESYFDEIQNFKKYVNSFVKTLTQFRQFQACQDTCSYYFFYIPPEKVIARITSLNKLKRIYENGSFYEKCEPIEEDRVELATNWEKEDDYLLWGLIMNCGYGEWKQILECSIPELQMLTLAQYMQANLQKCIDLEKMVQWRAQELLHRIASEIE